MTLVSGRYYARNNCSLVLHAQKKYFQNKEYIKIKGSLINKYNGIVYETKNYKLYKSLLQGLEVIYV